MAHLVDFTPRSMAVADESLHDVPPESDRGDHLTGGQETQSQFWPSAVSGFVPSVPSPRPEGTLLTKNEVATMFRVDPRTVTRWAKAGKLTSIRTLGGRLRCRESEVRALLAGIPQQRSE